VNKEIWFIPKKSNRI